MAYCFTISQSNYSLPIYASRAITTHLQSTDKLLIRRVHSLQGSMAAEHGPTIKLADQPSIRQIDQ